MGILVARDWNLHSVRTIFKTRTRCYRGCKDPRHLGVHGFVQCPPGHCQGQKAAPARQSRRLAFAQQGADRTPAPTGSPRPPARAGGLAAPGTQRLAQGLGCTCRGRPGRPPPRDTSAAFSPEGLWAGLVTSRGQASASGDPGEGYAPRKARAATRPSRAPASVPSAVVLKVFPRGSAPHPHPSAPQVGGSLRPAGGMTRRVPREGPHRSGPRPAHASSSP